MYSRKRNLRLFRGPAWMYSWRQPSGGPSTRAYAMSIDDTGLTGIFATAIGTSGQQGPYVTRDGGATWSQNTTGITFDSLVGTFGGCVARSSPNIMYCANGQSAVATGYIYESTDFGTSWTELTAAGKRNWSNIICNSTGTIVLAAAVGDRLYRSTDGGSSWTGLTGTVSSGSHGPMCMSEDGQTIVFGTTNGSRLQISRNGGTTFGVITLVPLATWTGLSCSADGSVIFGSSASSTVMCVVSTDNGVSWTSAINPSNRASNTGYRRTAMSSDGKRLFVTEGQVAVGGYIWMSDDRGVSWSSLVINNPNNWEGLAVTADGRTRILAGTAAVSKPWVGSGV